VVRPEPGGRQRSCQAHAQARAPTQRVSAPASPHSRWPCTRPLLPPLPQGTPKDLRKLEAARERVGFRRGADGRVSLLSDGEEFAVKADARMGGYLLLRRAGCLRWWQGRLHRALCWLPAGKSASHPAASRVPGLSPPSNNPCLPLTPGPPAPTNNPRPHRLPQNRDSRGYCYYLPPDPSGRLRQIDLSDDVLVAQLFANGLWQDIIEPLEVELAPKGGRGRGGMRAG
jgi:hypothetical protein